MTPTQIGEPRNNTEKNAPGFEAITSRSPLAQLLHALNQPLTGLQCSMEVALAGTRTPEQYRQGLRDGLELTERMRALVEAIREVADGLDEDTNEKEVEVSKGQGELETADLRAILRETVNDLKPVAESKTISIELHCSFILAVSARRPRLHGVIFRLLDSALSLAGEGSALKIEADSVEMEDRLRIYWEAETKEETRQQVFSRPELGLLVAQAGFERSGAEWHRVRAGGQETVSIRLPGISRKTS
jgi:signal transduction histidine kinase